MTDTLAGTTPQFVDFQLSETLMVFQAACR